MSKIDKARMESEGLKDLPALSFPGLYPITYVCGGDVLCDVCATKRVMEGETVEYDIRWEGQSVECDGGCGTMLETAYGDPDEHDEDAHE